MQTKTPLHRFIEGLNIKGLTSEGARGIADCQHNRPENFYNLAMGIKDCLDNKGYDISYMSNIPGMDEAQSHAVCTWVDNYLSCEEGRRELEEMLSYPIGKIYSLIDELTKNGKVDITSKLDPVDTEGHIMEGAILYGKRPYRILVTYEGPGTWEEKIARNLYDQLSESKDCDKVSEWLKDKDIITSWKLVGRKLTLTYKDGELQQISDDEAPQNERDVTRKARFIKDIPWAIPYKGMVIISGIATLSDKGLMEMNEKGQHRIKAYIYDTVNKALHGAAEAAELRVEFKAEALNYPYEAQLLQVVEYDENKFEIKPMLTDTTEEDWDNGPAIYNLRYVQDRFGFMRTLGFNTGGIGRGVTSDRVLDIACEWEESALRMWPIVDGLYFRMNDIQDNESVIDKMWIPLCRMS